MLQRDPHSPEDAKRSNVPDEQLWSWVDRDAPELAEHLEAYPEDRPRVDELRRAIRAVAGEDRDERTPDRIGAYPIRRRLGSGGMGVVFEADQIRTQRRVAIKVIRGAWLDDERTRRLFQREVEVLGRLDHPGIAQIYDAGETKEGSPFFVMELVDGKALDEWATGRRLDERLKAVVDVARAVHHAHEKGVIHRDLKPSNVHVTRDGRIKVLDFGLARIVDPNANASLTAAMSGKVIGTVRYMSPEQARGMASRVTPASDVYSIGVLLYELCAGRIPYDFEGADLFECARKVAEERVSPPSKYDDRVSPELDAVVMCALAKDPEKRYASAEELADDLERVLFGEDVKAPRDAGDEDLGTKIGRWGMEIGTAIGNMSAEIARAADEAFHSEKTKKTVDKSKKTMHAAAEKAREAGRKARASAHRASERRRERREQRRENGETIHIDLNPAIDVVGKAASAAGRGASAVASGTKVVVKKINLPSPRSVFRFLLGAFFLFTAFLFVASGFDVEETVDELGDFFQWALEGPSHMLEEIWRELT